MLAAPQSNLRVTCPVPRPAVEGGGEEVAALQEALTVSCQPYWQPAPVHTSRAVELRTRQTLVGIMENWKLFKDKK